MPNKTPTYRLRKGYNQAIVTLRDAKTKRVRDYWLGEFNSPESRERYHRIIAEWEAGGRILPAVLDLTDDDSPQGITVVELLDQYLRHAQATFAASELSVLKILLRILIQYHGSSPAAAFGPKKLRLVRDAMITGDPKANPPRKPYHRKSINKHMHRIGAIFKWAASHELLPASVYQQLKTLEPLKHGRCDALESDPVKAVPDHLVDPVQPHVASQVWALIQLQRYTGARSGEILKLRTCDLNMTGEVWTYTPGAHKTAHHGHARTIYFGPKAQAVLRPFIDSRDSTAYLFSPVEAEAEHRGRRRASRKTPLQYGNAPGTNRSATPARRPGDFYTPTAYRRAILRGCIKAFPPPVHLRRHRIKTARHCRWETNAEWKKRLGLEQWNELQAWLKGGRWCQRAQRIDPPASANI